MCLIVTLCVAYAFVVLLLYLLFCVMVGFPVFVCFVVLVGLSVFS